MAAIAVADWAKAQGVIEGQRLGVVFLHHQRDGHRGEAAGDLRTATGDTR